MATQKFSDLTATTTPNSASVFAIAYDGSSLGVTLSNIAANLPATTATSITTSGNATIGGDLTITGDDLFMATNTSGAALIADGTNFNPVVISGDLTISTGGVAAIGSGVIINADVNASAAIAFSKMANLTVSRLLVSDGSGDVSISAVTSTEAGYLDGVSSAIQTQLDSKASSSYVPTTITIADESSDTTCFPLFVTAATGDLPPKSGTNLAFNSSSGVLTATGFAGALTGNVTGNTSGTSGSTTGNAATATTATNVTVADESTDTTCFPLFATAATGDLAPKSGSNLSFNSNTGALTATSFVGTAPTPTVITVADESTDTTCFPLFVTAATGDLGPKSGTNLAFNSSSGLLTATGFSGPITGNVTGNASGSSATCSGLAATATALASARTIGGVSFDGTGNINLPGVNTAGNQNTSGTAAIATAVTITDNESTDEDNAVIFTSGGDVDGGNIGLESDGTCTYNPSTGKITATGFIGALTGEASAIADTTVTSAKLSGALVTPSTLDVNGNELILDADADTSITADTDDQIDFKIAGVEHISLTNSSGDTIIKPRVDAKDIIFQQFDGTSILEINDGAYAKFTAAGIVPEATLTDATTVTWNALTQSVSKITLGANRIMGLASGGVTGAFISLLVIQDGTGSRTITWNAAYEFTGDAAPTLTTTAAKGDLFVFRYNGAKWLETGRNLNLTLS
jgi:hypothetical protein